MYVTSLQSQFPLAHIFRVNSLQALNFHFVLIIFSSLGSCNLFFILWLEELKLGARWHRVGPAVCKRKLAPRHIAPSRRSLTKCLASENSSEFHSRGTTREQRKGWRFIFALCVQLNNSLRRRKLCSSLTPLKSQSKKKDEKSQTISAQTVSRYLILKSLKHSSTLHHRASLSSARLRRYKKTRCRDLSPFVFACYSHSFSRISIELKFTQILRN